MPLRRRRRLRARPRRVSAPVARNLAGLEKSVYNGILKIKKKHRLERLGISFYDSQTSLQWSYNADSLFHAASTIKIAVLLAVYAQVARGMLATDAPVHVRNRFTSIMDGKPFTVDLSAQDEAVAKQVGRNMTVQELAYEMITRSSNLATNLLVDVVGVEFIRRCLDELNVDGVVMARGVCDQAAYDAGVNNMVTANGVLRMLRLIADGRAYSPQVCAQMLEILLDTRAKSGIPAGLPGDAQIAHKTGNISTVHHDAGIVYIGDRRPYFLVVLTQFPAEVGRSTAVAEVSHGLFESLGRLKRDLEEEGGEPVSQAQASAPTNASAAR
jgi:beta-lactamase class A